MIINPYVVIGKKTKIGNNVEILSLFNDDMTGGVHNAFIYNNHVFAVNNGLKYDIINNVLRNKVLILESPLYTTESIRGKREKLRISL